MAEQAAERETEAARPWFAGWRSWSDFDGGAHRRVGSERPQPQRRRGGVLVVGADPRLGIFQQTADGRLSDRRLHRRPRRRRDRGVALASNARRHGAGVALVAYRLAGPRAGFWVGLHASEPAVSLSSQLVSTDVALLFFDHGHAGLPAPIAALRAGGVLLGVAGPGFLAKYAMVYFYRIAAHMLGRRRRAHFYGARRRGWHWPSADCSSPQYPVESDPRRATVGHLMANANLTATPFSCSAGCAFWASRCVFGPISSSSWRRGAKPGARPEHRHDALFGRL